MTALVSAAESGAVLGRTPAAASTSTPVLAVPSFKMPDASLRAPGSARTAENSPVLPDVKVIWLGPGLAGAHLKRVCVAGSVLPVRTWSWMAAAMVVRPPAMSAVLNCTAIGAAPSTATCS